MNEKEIQITSKDTVEPLQRALQAINLFDAFNDEWNDDFSNDSTDSTASPPPSPRWEDMEERHLCDFCRDINLQAATTHQGYPHALTWELLRENRMTCALCSLIWNSRKRRNKTLPRHDKSRIICRIGEFEGFAVLEFRSPAVSGFFSRVGFFCDEGNPLQDLRLRVKSCRYSRSGEVHKTLTLSGAPSEFKQSTEIKTTEIRIATRKPLTLTSSDGSFALAKLWLTNCQNHHSCSRNHSTRDKRREGTSQTERNGHSDGDIITGKTGYPMRVIDLEAYGPQSLDARLVPCTDDTSPYAALSYCWGTGRERHYITTRVNLADGYRHLQHDDMPLTIQHAFQVARRLHIRYIWVDALCIVQDSRADWHSEALKMGAIYSNAILTIAADHGWDVDAGLFNTNSLYQWIARSIPVNVTVSEDWKSEINFFTANLHTSLLSSVETMLESSPLSRRGWTFQERAMSSRILHYTAEQLIWECRELYQAEDSLPVIGPDWDHTRTLSATIFPSPGAIVHPDQLIHDWYGLVLEPYSERRFTFPSDRLPAIAGIAEIFGRKLQSEYISGTWTAGIAAGLSWYRAGKRWDNGCEELKGPIFSWSSQPSAVRWFLRTNTLSNWKVHIQIVDSFMENRKGEPYGEVQNVRLKVRGRLKPVVLSTQVFWGEISKEKPYKVEADNEGDDLDVCWVEDGLETTDGQPIGDIYIDNVLTSRDLFCLLLWHDTRNSGMCGLLVEKVRLSAGCFGWRRVGLADLLPVPNMWLTNDFQILTLI